MSATPGPRQIQVTDPELLKAFRRLNIMVDKLKQRVRVQDDALLEAAAEHSILTADLKVAEAELDKARKASEIVTNEPAPAVN